MEDNSMAFDVTQLTAKNVPWRWVRIGQWLEASEPGQLAALDADYKSTMDYVNDMDVLTSNPPTTIASFASKTATSITFNIASPDIDLPITFDYDEAHEVWDLSAPAAPGTATQDVVVVGGQATFSGLSAGNCYSFTFAATDSGNTEGAIASVSGIVLQPAVPTTLLVSTSGVADWDDMDGATSYVVQHRMQNEGTGDWTAWTTVTPEPTASTYSVTGLDANDIVEVKVAAKNEGGTSSFCATVQETIS